MRVLITGITGFTGRHLAEYALTQGAEVFGVALDKNFPPGVTGHQGDLTQPGVAETLVADVQPDHVFHLAALVPASGVQVAPEKLFVVNGWAPCEYWRPFEAMPLPPARSSSVPLRFTGRCPQNANPSPRMRRSTL